MPLLPIPPANTPYIDPITKSVSLPWQNYFLSLTNALSNDIPPKDAPYWVSTAVPGLTAERNIGLLATGYLKITTALGAATPSTSTTIPVADLTGTLPIARGGTNSGTALSASAIAVSNGTAIIQGPAGTTTTLLHGNAAGLPTYAAASLTADVSGILPLANGGTAANLSATGGTSQVLRQSSAAAVVTVSQLASTDISGLVNPVVGTYTPTLTNVANLDASTAYVCQYVRIGAVVVVSGRVDMDPTTTATFTQLGLTLPVASNLAAFEQCAGTAAASSAAGQSAAIAADAANNRAEIRFTAVGTTNTGWQFIFSYQII